MEIGRQIEEVANFVDTKSLQESSHYSAVKHNYSELEKEIENMTMLMETKLDAIMSEKYRQEQEIERLQDINEKTIDNLQQVKQRRNDAIAEETKTNEDLKRAQEKLAAADEALKQFRFEAASVQKQLESVPKLSQNKTLMYTISKLTLDETKKDNILKGFVINSVKDDVSTFTFNTEDPGVSSHFMTNYIWDLIAAGVSREWSSF